MVAKRGAVAERVQSAGMIVLDANILICAVLGKRVGHLLDQYTQHEPEVISFGLLSLETQLPLRDFRTL